MDNKFRRRKTEINQTYPNIRFIWYFEQINWSIMRYVKIARYFYVLVNGSRLGKSGLFSQKPDEIHFFAMAKKIVFHHFITDSNHSLPISTIYSVFAEFLAIC